MHTKATNRPLREVFNIKGYNQEKAGLYLQWYESLLEDNKAIWPNTGRYTSSATPGPHVRLSGSITIKHGNDTLHAEEVNYFPHSKCKDEVGKLKGTDQLKCKIAELKAAIECNRQRVRFNQRDISYEAYSSCLNLFLNKYRYSPIWFTSQDPLPN
jgi:hypothetical protein